MSKPSGKGSGRHHLGVRRHFGRLKTRIPPRARSYLHVAQGRLWRSGGSPPLPHACHLVLSWKCNARCLSCAAWQREDEDELNANQWATVFAKLRALDIVKIIGGEPFLRTDLEAVVEAIRREINPFIVQLVTNGTLTDEILAFLETQAWPGLHLRVSLDGLEENHDRSRGVEGSFRKVMATLEGASRVRRHKRFRLAVNFTLTDRSLPDLDEVVARCRPLGVEVIPGFPVKPFLRHADLAREKVGTIGVREARAHLERLKKEDFGARSGFNRLEQWVLRTFNRDVYRKHVAGDDALRFRCAELRHLIYLMPNGDLVTCGINHEPVGNLYLEDFGSVWYGEKAGAFRAAVDACPGCMQGAVELMSRVYRG